MLSTRPRIAVLVGLAALTVAAALTVPLFPLAAPFVTAAAAVVCLAIRRRSPHRLITVLLFANGALFVMSLLIDLLFLSAGQQTNAPPH